MITKRHISEQVINSIQRGPRNADFSMPREQEIWLRMDAIVNHRARQSYYENWVFSGASLDEQFMTTWDGENAIGVHDQDNGNPSYLELPTGYIELPRNGGIELWPLSFEKGNHSVVIMDPLSFRRYRSLKAGNMQGRLYGYVQGNRFIFGKANVATEYSDLFGLRLPIRDSSMIAVDAPYPVPADKVGNLVDQLVDYFLVRKSLPNEVIRDGNDQPVLP